MNGIMIEPAPLCRACLLCMGFTSAVDGLVQEGSEELALRKAMEQALRVVCHAEQQGRKCLIVLAGICIITMVGPSTKPLCEHDQMQYQWTLQAVSRSDRNLHTRQQERAYVMVSLSKGFDLQVAGTTVLSVAHMFLKHISANIVRKRGSTHDT